MNGIRGDSNTCKHTTKMVYTNCHWFVYKCHMQQTFRLLFESAESKFSCNTPIRLIHVHCSWPKNSATKEKISKFLDSYCTLGNDKAIDDDGIGRGLEC